MPVTIAWRCSSSTSSSWAESWADGSGSEACQGLSIEAVLAAAELAGDQRLALGFEGGELAGGHGPQHLRHPLARAAAAGGELVLAEDAHAVFVKQAEEQ